MLASTNPVEHILDVPWRIGGHEVPWMSAQIAVMILAALLLAVGLPFLVRRNQRRRGSAGGGLAEMMFSFVRMQIARVAMGERGDKATGFLATLFMFLLMCNLLSLVPLLSVSDILGLYGWGGVDSGGHPMYVTPVGGTPASSVWVCAAFAAMTLVLVFLSGYVVQVQKLSGPSGGSHHGPPAGPNLWMAVSHWISARRWPVPAAAVLGVWTWLDSFVPPVPGLVGLFIWPVLLVLEIIGYIAKCFALCIRLLANMNAGHILLAVLLTFAQQSRGWWMAGVGLPAGAGFIAIMLLELLVAIIQAYIFTLLSALFISLAISEH